MTPRVDFYILPGVAEDKRLAVACRLAEKAYLRDLAVVVLAGDAPELRALDELLWTFNERSFVPHRIWPDGTAADPETRVHLTAQLPATADIHADFLVNLGTRLPDVPQRFARIAEIVDADPERRRLGRERFKAYRELQMTIETHQLDET